MVARLRLWVSILTLTVASASAQTPMGSAFTYQGRLADTGFPPTANYDFEFRLFGQPALGSLLATLAVPNVPVVSGLFTVSLDFGTVHFAGDMRFLEIGIKPAGGPLPYTTLTPRQVLAP